MYLNKINAVFQKLFVAADQHGEDDDPGHTVGDLQGLLRRALALMTVGQKLEFLKSDEVGDLCELGARGVFDADDLLEEVDLLIKEATSEAVAKGYRFIETENGFFWETVAEESFPLPTLADAVFSAIDDIAETESAYVAAHRVNA